MKGDESSIARLGLIAITVLAIIGLAYVSLFKPGAVSDWKIKIDTKTISIETEGASMTMGFAMILLAMLVILLLIKPQYMEAAVQLKAILGDSITALFHQFR